MVTGYDEDWRIIAYDSSVKTTLNCSTSLWKSNAAIWSLQDVLVRRKM